MPTFELVDDGELLFQALFDDECEADKVHAVAVLQGHRNVHQAFLCQELSRILEMSKCPSGFSLSGTVPGPRNVEMSIRLFFVRNCPGS